MKLRRYMVSVLLENDKDAVLLAEKEGNEFVKVGTFERYKDRTGEKLKLDAQIRVRRTLIGALIQSLKYNKMGMYCRIMQVNGDNPPQKIEAEW